MKEFVSRLCVSNVERYVYELVGCELVRKGRDRLLTADPFIVVCCNSGHAHHRQLFILSRMGMSWIMVYSEDTLEVIG